MTSFWIGVASLSHVKRAVAGGFAQLGHGKAAPLRRMKVGDWLIYYSPKTDLDGGAPLQQFTAIGTVVGDSVSQHRMGRNFVPSRRDMKYLPCKVAPIAPLISKLSFIKDPARWGFPLRRGHIKIPNRDAELIAGAMGVRIDA